MPKKASFEERVNWHVEHTKNCGCRPPPKSIAAAVSAASKRKKKRK